MHYARKSWAKNVSERDYLVVYKHKKIIAFYYFSFSNDVALQKVLPTIFAKQHIFQYRANCLLDMIGCDWYDNYL